LLEKEIKEANKILKDSAEQEMEKWKSVDGKIFSSAYFQFEEEQPFIEQRMG